MCLMNWFKLLNAILFLIETYQKFLQLFREMMRWFSLQTISKEDDKAEPMDKLQVKIQPILRI